MISGRSFAVIVATLVVFGSVGLGLGVSHVAPPPGPKSPKAVDARAPPRALPTWAYHVAPSAFVPALTVILPDGTVYNSTTSTPSLVRSGNNYTITKTFIGGILDERNNSVIYGDSNTLTADASLSSAIMVQAVSNVTVDHLTITAHDNAVQVLGAAEVNVSYATLLSVETAVIVGESADVTILHDSAPGTYGISVFGSTNVTVADTVVGVGAGWGFTVSTSSNVSLRDDSAQLATDGGFLLSSDSGVTVWGGNVTNSPVGVRAIQVDDLGVAWTNGSFVSGEFLDLSEDTNVSSTHNAGEDDAEYLAAGGGYGVSTSFDDFPHTTGPALLASALSHLTVASDSFIDSAGSSAVELISVEDASFTATSISGFETAGFNAQFGANLLFSGVNASLGATASDPAFTFTADRNVTVVNCSARGSGMALTDDLSSGLNVSSDDFAETHSATAALEFESDSDIVADDDNLSAEAVDAVVIYDASFVSIGGANATRAGANSIVVQQSSHIDLVDDVVAFARDTGLWLIDDSNFTVEGDNASYLSGATSLGINVAECDGGTIENSGAVDNDNGLVAIEDSDITVLGNNLSLSVYGIQVIGASNAVVEANQFWENKYSFEIAGDQGTLFFHNNFVGDLGYLNFTSIDQVRFSDGYPIGGNYWSNHTGPDAERGPGQNVTGSDGIVDHPFVINATIFDEYPLVTPWVQQYVTFQESGLAPHTAWSVVVNGTTYSSDTATLLYPEPNGANSTIPYRVPTVAGYSGPTPGSGGLRDVRTSFDVEVVFAPLRYNITFVASGLARGTTWSVEIAGSSASSPTFNLTVNETAGSYAYTPQMVHGYLLASLPGNVTVVAAPVRVSIVYVALPNTTSPIAKASSTTGYPAMTVYGLLAALVAALVLALVGLALWRRARRGPPAQPITPYTGPAPPSPVAPPPVPPPSPGGGPSKGPPPGATGGGSP